MRNLQTQMLFYKMNPTNTLNSHKKRGQNYMTAISLNVNGLNVPTRRQSDGID